MSDLIWSRGRILWLVLAGVVIAAGGIYLYLTGGAMAALTNQDDDPQGASLQEAVARIGDLQVSVSGSGELIPATTTELSFSESGVLLELLVEVGDEVSVGDILARLRVDKTQAQRQAEIANAELVVVRAQQSLVQLYENAQLEAAQALTALEEAQRELDDLQDTQTEQAAAQAAVAQEQGAVDEAEMNLYILGSSPSDEAYEIAYSALLFKEKELAEIERDVEKLELQIKNSPNQDVKDRLRLQLLNLELSLARQRIEVDNAIDKYKSLDDQADPTQLQLAQAQLETAKEQLKAALEDLLKAQASPGEGQVGMAKAQLAQAQADWERLRAGPDPDQVALAEANLAVAQARLDQAQNQESILDLAAPIDGQVLSVGAVVGERIGGQASDPVVSLADTSQPLLEVYLDESDMGQVQDGYPVDVVFDALPEHNYRGQVIRVYPELSQAGVGTSEVRAVVQLEQSPLEGLQTLPLGLNASVEIIAGRVEGALLVPVEALYEVESSLDSGIYVVYVTRGETIERRQVSVGLKDYTNAEILQGLEAGETVLLGEVEELEAALKGQMESDL